jgi:molybdopterin molybdotransferase
LVRPALDRLCGHNKPNLARVKGELMRDLRQLPGRTAFLPAWVCIEPGGWKIEPLRWKGSADIIGFSRANAAVIVPAERDFIAKGEEVEAMLLPDYFRRTK